MKNTICAVIGVVGSTIAALFGGWDAALATLVLFMGIDYITGIMVAAVFHKSPKSQTVRWKAVQGGKVCVGRV